MDKIINKFVISELPPKFTNVGWIRPVKGTDKCDVLFYNNGKWSSEGATFEEITIIKDKIKVDYVYTSSGELEPDTYYVITPSSDINIVLKNDSNTEVKEYLGEIVFGDTVYNITFPDNIIWDETPSFVTNAKYAFSIVNGLGVIREFKVV